MKEIFEKIIDDIHPAYMPISDEECYQEDEEQGRFMRTFLHKDTGEKFTIFWKVIFGTPETVQTIFETVERHTTH